jgi:hypothetical protein
MTYAFNCRSLVSEQQAIAYLKEKIGAEVQWNVVWGPPELTQNGKVLIIRNDWLRSQGLSRPVAAE